MLHPLSSLHSTAIIIPDGHQIIRSSIAPRQTPQGRYPDATDPTDRIQGQSFPLLQAHLLPTIIS